LLVSEELDELMRLSDRIAVMYEGEIVGIMEDEDADIQTIGLMMTGSLRMDGKEDLPGHNLLQNDPEPEAAAEDKAESQPPLAMASPIVPEEAPLQEPSQVFMEDAKPAQEEAIALDEPKDFEQEVNERIEKFFDSIEEQDVEEKPAKPDLPERPLTEAEEKERVLRKVLGDKYPEDGEK
jgi:ABC-type multidrug transport system ATPase subunit